MRGWCHEEIGTVSEAVPGKRARDKEWMATVSEAVARAGGGAAVSEAVPPMVEVVRETVTQ